MAPTKNNSAKQSPRSTGNEVLAYCSACKMDLAAVVVAKVGDEIVKVQCKTCKKERAYKAPKGVSSPVAAEADGGVETGIGKKAAKSSKKAKSAAKEETKSIFAEWQSLMDASKNAKRLKYTPKAHLEVGHVIEHPNFGEGVVTKVLFPNKAEVVFKDDLKIMIHSR